METKDTIMKRAYVEGHITAKEYMEYCNLRDRFSRLEKLSWALSRGEKCPDRAGHLTQQDVADILGVTQQSVSKSESSGLSKVRKAFKDLKLDRHLLSKDDS